MSNLPRLKDIVMRDTPFAQLMNKRVFNVLLIATKYDAFMLEDDGRVDEQIFNEYTALSLRYPPRFTQVTTTAEALRLLDDRNFELVIVMPNMDNRDIFAGATDIKQRYPSTPLVVLTPFSREVSRRVAQEDLTCIDYVFSWLGNAELLLAIIKLIEDRLNAPSDVASVGVQIILLVEDSVRFYSAALPHLYRLVLEQSKEISNEALNDHLKTMRMRGRPKIMLARTYEEAVNIFETYRDNLLGVVSDMSFAREGKKDPLAGLSLCSLFREYDSHLPLILESSEDANSKYAERLHAGFLRKQTKQYPQDLRREVLQRFGFGDFLIIDPATGDVVFRIRDLKDLQQKLPDIPAASLAYHISQNHFSRFFFSRAMFPPGEMLKGITVDDFSDIEEARRFIADVIAEYRHMKNEGVVAIYQRDRFDEFSNFTRIGNGSLGGKGRGLAFMGSMVKRYPRLGSDCFTVNIPKTVVVCTDIFDEFMETNGLASIALGDAPDSDILAAFEEATLPERVIDDLVSLINVVDAPIAVRSSSLLEDSHYQPFAGVYKTYMVPRSRSKVTMLHHLRSAIKAVYASVFYRESKRYLTATQNLIDQEKMAIVLQEVVGAQHDATLSDGSSSSLFYPTLSGVARSLNFYPVAPEKVEDGVANIALGLGKYIVDGGRTLRFSPRHPCHILQLATVESALRETQRDFLALDVNNALTAFETNEAFNLKRLPVREADAHGTLRYVASTYDANDNVVRDGYYPQGRKLVTFSNLLQSTRFPLASTICQLLDIGSKEMGRAVEIEFAMNIEGDAAHFYLLQIRPIVSLRETVEGDVSAVPDDDCIVRSSSALGNGTLTDIYDLVYVDPNRFDAAENRTIADEVDALNAKLSDADRPYILIGPGRWGSSDEWLGIPVKWASICGARVVVEQSLDNYQVEPSQGTHFFQNLTSFGVGYLTIGPNTKTTAPNSVPTSTPNAPTSFINSQWLEAQEAETTTPHLRHLHFPAPLTVRMDGRKSLAVIEKPRC